MLELDPARRFTVSQARSSTHTATRVHPRGIPPSPTTLLQANAHPWFSTSCARLRLTLLLPRLSGDLLLHLVQ